MSGTGPAYRITDLRHRYGSRIVLDVPALDIARGETLAVIGPSGAGKTTLLRLLQFLERPTEGRIEYAGTPAVFPMPIEISRTVTTVFQRSVMLDRSVRDNVVFGRRLRGSRAFADVDALIERLALQHLAKAPARSLSGGEMQRVALARAIATGADVLLLDEPAANLDPRNVAIVEAMIKELQGRGTTLVLVTHNTHEARRLASRTLVLLDGQVIEVGPTATVFDSPADPRTRGFLRGDFIY
ncbi:MAG: ATP-binding cassette domain-containing protein [Acidobacteria bacterium]|nr:ATP-binding cassette domain-containing protein [Acidobacteriota bacterium]